MNIREFCRDIIDDPLPEYTKKRMDKIVFNMEMNHSMDSDLVMYEGEMNTWGNVIDCIERIGKISLDDYGDRRVEICWCGRWMIGYNWDSYHTMIELVKTVEKSMIGYNDDFFCIYDHKSHEFDE